ncbi:hypothetical protein HRbin39_01342 [bacterium HR39]|nr:hypothetical protein HRbin39_01342 [bacterium HR39]
MPAVVRLLLAVALLAAAPAAAAELVAGIVVHVRDGDTIVVGRTPVRLWGVAAPERDGPLGRTATGFVRDRALARHAVCTGDGSRSRDRVVARCRIEGNDLGRALVAAGLARDCPAFSGGAYAAFEPPDAPIRELYPLPPYCVPRRTAQLDGSSSTP